MPRRTDWNLMGPPVPLWFRAQLRQIDPKLVLQFMPPSDVAEGGVNPSMFPRGVWRICRRMPRTGWLHGTPVFSLVAQQGQHMRPSAALVNQIRNARDMWRRDRLDDLTDEFDRSVASMRRAQEQQSKEAAMEQLAACMRRHNYTSYRGRRIRVPGGSDG